MPCSMGGDSQMGFLSPPPPQCPQLVIEEPHLRTPFHLSLHYWYHMQQELPSALPLTLDITAFPQLYLLWHEDCFFKTISHSEYFPHVHCHQHPCLFGDF